MPTLKEAAVAVTGHVMDVENLTHFETKKFDGLRVVLATGDGFANVKIPAEDSRDVLVNYGESVAWMVRFGAWSRGENAQTSCKFLREVNENDLDKLVSARKPVPAGK